MLVALIQNNAVCGICDFTSDQITQFSPYFEQIIDITNLTPQPQIGWGFDGNNIASTAPTMQITKLAMRQRFLTAEMIAIMTYVTSNPNSVVALLMGNLQVATYVDLNRSDTQAGISYLVSQGLLTSARATAILITPPTAYEAYNP